MFIFYFFAHSILLSIGNLEKKVKNYCNSCFLKQDVTTHLQPNVTARDSNLKRLQTILTLLCKQAGFLHHGVCVVRFFPECRQIISNFQTILCKLIEFYCDFSYDTDIIRYLTLFLMDIQDVSTNFFTHLVKRSRNTAVHKAILYEKFVLR